MGYINFLLWAQKVSRNKILQKYLNKAWQEGTKGGKEILQSQWPKLLKKAQDFKTKFKTFEPKIVPKKPNPLGDALKTGKYTKVPTPKHLTPKTKIKDLQIGPHIDSRGRIWPKFVKPVPKGPAKIIPFPKKPPGKADGGSIDKALLGRSRDI
jgi:hypothetical protein|tara:strand:- start:149 stop:607 length:459 start_codon:yes stop_codon:yes gene_type:complete